MLFNSQALILGLLPLALAGWYLAPTRDARQAWVVLASLVFYAFWDPRFVPVLVGLTLLNWVVARAHAGAPRGWWADIGIAMNLGVLGWVKYANFIADNVAWALGGRHEQWNIILPLGVSFYVFQKVSYLIDLKRGQAKIYRLSDFFLFVTFFPQLVAGPLVRHNEVIWQFALDPRRPEMTENLARGLVLFTIGLVKKVAIADTVAPVADAVFGRAAAAQALGAGDAWLGTLAYTLQIYFDFSGYSDMALGLALMFGLRLPANFDAPYRSASIREFWRRWHMTLSRFLRDYLYIPLGGNRSGAARQAVNVVVTMLLAGLWHGAAWTFVVWGGLHGIALAVNGAWARAGLRMPWVIGWALTLAFVMLGWVLFRAPDFATAARMFATMAGPPWTGGGAVAMDTTQTVALLAGCVTAVFGPASQVFALERLRPRPWAGAAAGVVLFLMLLLIGGRVPNEFIYFQF